MCPQTHSATLSSLSSNDGSNNIIVKSVGWPRVVIVKNANTGATVGSHWLTDPTNDATINVSSQPNPFRGEISVTDRNSPYGIWTSKIFEKIYRGDSFALIAENKYNPPIVRGYAPGFQDRVPKMLKYSQFTTETVQGHDDEYIGWDHT